MKASLSMVIPSRHVIQLWLVAGLMIASGFQLVQGPSASFLRNGNPPGLWYTQAALLGIGGAMLLASAIVAVREPWTATGLSAGGMMMLSVTMSFYVYLIVHNTPGWAELNMSSFWFICALLGGFTHRAIQLFGGALHVKHTERRS